MTKSKKILLLMLGSILAGGILGTLYAPAEGAKLRRKLGRFRKRCCCGGCDPVDNDKESLEELSDVLQKELDKINEKIEKLA